MPRRRAEADPPKKRSTYTNRESHFLARSVKHTKVAAAGKISLVRSFLLLGCVIVFSQSSSSLSLIGCFSPFFELIPPPFSSFDKPLYFDPLPSKKGEGLIGAGDRQSWKKTSPSSSSDVKRTNGRGKEGFPLPPLFSREEGEGKHHRQKA